MIKEKILYVFMNKNFEFVDKNGDVVRDIVEAAGYKDLETAKKERVTFDEPDEWKIVKKKITFELEEIVDE